MHELVGGTLGRYRVTGLVGKGGMATVYRGEDPALDRIVAIKVLHPHLASDPLFVARFHHEAKAVAALKHPNIVQVFDFGSEDEAYFMVMEYIEGPTLATFLARGTDRRAGLAMREVERLFPPLCSAIDYAHGKGMVHRDIKPSNIILTKSGDPVLTDYGIAKIAGVTSYTAPGTVIGSAHYMSPEQAQGLASDHRSDLYSLGIVLFEALTGRVPFDGETTATVLAQHIAAPIPSARVFNPDLPPAIEGVLAKVLAKDPAGRYQTGVELKEALLAALATAGLAETVAVTRAEPAIGTTAVDDGLDHAEGNAVVAATRVDAPRAQGDFNGAQSLAGDVQEATKLRRRRGQGFWVSRGGRFVLAAFLVVALAAIGAVLYLTQVREQDSQATSTTTVAAVSTTVTALPDSSTTVPPGPTTTTLDPAAAATLAEADSSLQRGRLDEAIDKYQQVLEVAPNSDAARAQLGIAYLLKPNMHEVAEEQLKAAVQANPSNSTALTFLGLAQFQYAYSFRTGGYQEAEKTLLSALTLDPANGRAHGFLGEVYTETGDGETGLAEARKGVELMPDDFWTNSSLGYVRALRGEWTESVEPYRRAVTLQPNYAFLQLLLCEALRHTKEYEESLAFGKSALALGQGYESKAHALIGHTQWRMGDLTGAVGSFQKALALDDMNDFAHFGLGAVLYRQGDYEAALQHLERATALVPYDSTYHGWVGACLVELRRYPEARAELERALELDANNADARDLLAQLEKAGH